LKVIGLALNVALELHAPDLFLDLFDGQSGNPLPSVLRIVAAPDPMQMEEASGVRKPQLLHKGVEPPTPKFWKSHQPNVLTHFKTSRRMSCFGMARISRSADFLMTRL
jgi:hypothetical protein